MQLADFPLRLIEPGAGLLPVPTVELADCRDYPVIRIKAAEVDAPRLWMAPRLVEALDPAGSTEEMLRSPGAEAVRGQLVRTAEQFEIAMRHDQVQKPCLAADRAIAVEHFERRLDRDRETHRAAVATALQLHSTVTE